MLETISHFIFGLLCHQDPSILFQVEGQSVALCPRCIGLQLGFIISLILLKVTYRDGFRFNKKLAAGSALGISIMLFDWRGAAILGIYEPNTISRLITGSICAFFLAVLFLAYRNRIFHPLKEPQSKLSWIPILYGIAIAALAGILVLSPMPWALITLILLLTVVSNATIILGTAIHRIILLYQSTMTTTDTANPQ